MADATMTDRIEMPEPEALHESVERWIFCDHSNQQWVGQRIGDYRLDKNSSYDVWKWYGWAMIKWDNPAIRIELHDEDACLLFKAWRRVK